MKAMQPATIHEFVSHLSILSLWDYSRNSNALAGEELGHLMSCEFCVKILGLARIAHSLPDLRIKMKEHGIVPG
jgi:hypothetical protein